jgi:hypothetical protein
MVLRETGHQLKRKREREMKLQLLLTPIVLFGLLPGLLNADSTTETIIWAVVGSAGLIGVATLGMSSKQVIAKVKGVS